MRSILKEKSFRAGEYFCKIGETKLLSAYIGAGYFEAVYTDESGKSVIKKFYSPGQKMAPYRTLVTNEPSQLDYIALTDSYLIYIEKEQIQELFKRHSAWQEIGRKLFERELLQREDRERDLLFKPPETRYLEFIQKNPELTRVLSDKKIASYLGITNVSLSRIKKRLK